MKKTKILFGLVTLLFAAAGAFATSKKVPNDYWYKLNGTSGTCTLVQEVPFDCETGANGCVFDVPDVGLRQLYLTNDCDQELQRQ